MNWEQTKGQWNQAKGAVRKQWGKLTAAVLADMLWVFVSRFDHSGLELSAFARRKKEEILRRAP